MIADAHGVGLGPRAARGHGGARQSSLLAEMPAPWPVGRPRRRRMLGAGQVAGRLGRVTGRRGHAVRRRPADQECWLSVGRHPMRGPSTPWSRTRPGPASSGCGFGWPWGSILEPEPPRADGWAVEVRLLALDPDEATPPAVVAWSCMACRWAPAYASTPACGSATSLMPSRPGHRHHHRLGNGRAQGVSGGSVAPSSAQRSSSAGRQQPVRAAGSARPPRAVRRAARPRLVRRARGDRARSSVRPSRWRWWRRPWRPTRRTWHWSAGVLRERRAAAGPRTPKRSALGCSLSYRGAHHRLRVDRTGPSTYRDP